MTPRADARAPLGFAAARRCADQVAGAAEAARRAYRQAMGTYDLLPPRGAEVAPVLHLAATRMTEAKNLLRGLTDTLVMGAVGFGSVFAVLVLLGPRWSHTASLLAALVTWTVLTNAASAILARGENRQRRQVPVARPDADPDDVRQEIAYIRDNITAARTVLSQTMAALPYEHGTQQASRRVRRDRDAAELIRDAHALLAMANATIDEHEQRRDEYEGRRNVTVQSGDSPTETA